MTMDTLSLRGLKLDTVIGMHDWERKLRQTVVIDLDIEMDAQPAAASDQLKDTVDYAAIAQRLAETVEGAEFRLIEALAESCARLLLTEFAVQRLTLTLHKPAAVRQASDVALRIERQRSDYA